MHTGETETEWKATILTFQTRFEKLGAPISKFVEQKGHVSVDGRGLVKE